MIKYDFYNIYSLIYFFFFQAEDGIRDVAVTGVQTCALPIYVLGRHRPGAHGGRARRRAERGHRRTDTDHDGAVAQPGDEIGRASCRKECRSRWSPYH